ncbi:helix-turn-helix domain-containing protein [Anaerobium acetethylicum]|uniref:AraC-type DNA-binding protein n=1 Tax=Anaerobium acetethylicum TaxID=1619234 RepID=A0A1D3TRH4_9FIRM|nr:AraC family transcriptional regulator [Anaerobium acetethylicum]SCP96325.1 AraC-type DNA-binding protein [Anaerobium acetethylicum]
MSYESISLKQELVINQIVTIHYFEYASDFSYSGESHDFWEIMCVDKGEVHVVADDRSYTLKKGDIIFHKPNEFHALKANGQIAPNIVVLSFVCNSECMRFFENKVLSISEAERYLLAQIIVEAKKTYKSKLNDPFLEKLMHADHVPFGSEQLIKLFLEQFFLQLYRRYTTVEEMNSTLPKTLKKKNENQLYSCIINYLENNIQKHLTIEQICKDNIIGRSQLQKLFRYKHNCGVIDYFCKMKIDMAKQLIRDNHMNFTQISDYLGYTSIHYFSRQFKQVTEMTPSEYSSSIKVLAEKSKCQSSYQSFYC